MNFLFPVLIVLNNAITRILQKSSKNYLRPTNEELDNAIEEFIKIVENGISELCKVKTLMEYKITLMDVDKFLVLYTINNTETRGGVKNINDCIRVIAMMKECVKKENLENARKQFQDERTKWEESLKNNPPKITKKDQYSWADDACEYYGGGSID